MAMMMFPLYDFLLVVFYDNHDDRNNKGCTW